MMILFLLAHLAGALQATDIPTFTSPALEALVPPFESAATDLGDCPPRIKRVRASDLGEGQVVENALNAYVSDLQTDRDRQYDFGVITNVPRNEERVRASVLELGQTEAVGALAQTLWTTLERESQFAFEAGTAFYSRRPTIEEEYTLRVVVDHATNEFLLMAVGRCH